MPLRLATIAAIFAAANTAKAVVAATTRVSKFFARARNKLAILGTFAVKNGVISFINAANAF